MRPSSSSESSPAAVLGAPSRARRGRGRHRGGRLGRTLMLLAATWLLTAAVVVTILMMPTFLQGMGDGEIGMEGLFAAAEDDGVGGLDAEDRCVGGDVGA